jgi:hypothetical protein
MKKIILTGAILLIASTGYTSYQNIENSYNTVNVKVKNVKKIKHVTKEFNTYVNEDITVNESKKKRFEVGVGTHVTILKNKKEDKVFEKVQIDYSYDWQNSEQRAIAYVDFDATELKVFKKVGSFFKGLFTKGQ